MVGLNSISIQTQLTADYATTHTEPDCGGGNFHRWLRPTFPHFLIKCGLLPLYYSEFSFEGEIAT